MSDSEKTVVDEESSNILVVDPEDYSKTRKLKSIQEAKDHYKSFIVEENEWNKRLHNQYVNGEEAYQRQRAEALAMIGSELLPLIEMGLEKGGLSESDMKIEVDGGAYKYFDGKEMDIRDIIESQGKVNFQGEVEVLPRYFQQKIYRQFERIEQKLGIGLEVEEEKDPAEI